MSYLVRRGKKTSCRECGQYSLDYDSSKGETYCRICGTVVNIEMQVSVEKNKDGDVTKRTADKGIFGSKVDKKSHPLQRRYQKYDQSKSGVSEFEANVKSIIEQLHTKKTEVVQDMEEIFLIKRDYSKLKKKKADSFASQTNSEKKFKKGEMIPFLRPGGRESGNYLSAIVLVKHYPKLKRDWNANVSNTIQEVSNLINSAQITNYKEELHINNKRKKTILADIKGLKKAWIFLTKHSSSPRIRPPIPGSAEDPRNIITSSYREMFGKANSEFDNLIYSPKQDIWNVIKTPSNLKSLKSWIWEIERLRKSLNISEMRTLYALERAIPKELKSEAADAYKQLMKYGGN